MIEHSIYNLLGKLHQIGMLNDCYFLQMDARSLATEMAPLIIWQKGQRPDFYRQFWNQPSKNQSKTNVDPARDNGELDMLAGEKSDLCSLIACMYI